MRGVREPRKHHSFLLVLVLGGNSNNSVFPVGSSVRGCLPLAGDKFLVGVVPPTQCFPLVSSGSVKGRGKAVLDLERGFCECLSFLKKTQQQWTVH